MLFFFGDVLATTVRTFVCFLPEKKHVVLSTTASEVSSSTLAACFCVSRSGRRPREKCGGREGHTCAFTK